MNEAEAWRRGRKRVAGQRPGISGFHWLVRMNEDVGSFYGDLEPSALLQRLTVHLAYLLGFETPEITGFVRTLHTSVKAEGDGPNDAFTIEELRRVAVTPVRS